MTYKITFTHTDCFFFHNSLAYAYHIRQALGKDRVKITDRLSGKTYE